MTRQRLISTSATTAVATAFLLTPAAIGAIEITRSTIDGGGGTSSSASFTLVGGIGQHDATATSSSASFTLTGGFVFAAAGPNADCAADLNGDNVVDGADLGLLLGNWGDGGGEGTGDLNGDGTVNGADLGLLLGSWGAC